MPDKNLLPMLGLCKRGGMLAIGEEPVDAVTRARDARLLLLACDAADNTARRLRHFADAGQCLWLRLPYTKEELGRILGRNSCAILAITDIGFAAAFARRLAAENPRQYGDAAEKLAVKAQRAAQRKAEQLAHEKNLRQGRKKKTPQPQQEEPVAPSAGKDRSFSGPGSQKKAAGSAVSIRKKTAGAPEKSGAPAGRRKSASSRSGTKKAYNPYAHSLPVKKGKGSYRKTNTAKSQG